METEEKIHYNELLSYARTLFENEERLDTIETQLREKCGDIVLATVIFREAKHAHYTKLRTEGFRFILFGAICAFAGFVITLMNFNTSRSIDFALYGLTTIGLVIVFMGLRKIFG